MKEKSYPKAIPGEPRWVDFDKDNQLWCVFGLTSGHAYSSHASESDANITLKNWLNDWLLQRIK